MVDSDYMLKADIFSTIEVLGELYDDYYTEVSLSDLNESVKRKLYKRILSEQKNISFKSLKTRTDLDTANETFQRTRSVLMRLHII